ncbi:MAG: hypothetical protein ACI3YI_03560 [Bacteroidaceae bacterium]
MNKTLTFLVLLALLLSCEKPHVDYVLSWKGDAIGVSVDVISDQDTILFSYSSDNGGQTDQMSWIHDFIITEGKVLTDSATRTFSVLPDNGKVCFSYDVQCTLPEGYGAPGGCLMDMFRPDIDEKMLYSRTENIFIIPHGEQNADIAVNVVWTSTPDYPVFCLYNPGHGTDQFKGKVSDIAFSVMAGDPLLDLDTLDICGNTHFLVTALRKNEKMNKSDLNSFFKTIYASISGFWEENYNAPYSFLIFPFRRNTFEVTGNGFPNGFVSRYDATEDTILNLNRRDVYTHEIGHKWMNNGTIWFAEGFDEMQTGYHLVASGLEKPSYFAKYFNNALRGLHHNPHKNATDKEAEELFWDDGDYTWLLYWRGFSYAFHLAGIYEKETGVHNAWKPMMKAVKPFLDDFSAEKFIEAMSKLMDRKRLEKDYRQFIVDGKDFDFFPQDLPSGCTIIREKDGTPQLQITDSILFAEHFK